MFLVMLAEKETEMVFLHKDVCFPFRRSAVLQDGEVGGGGRRPQEHGAGVEVIVWVTVFRVWGGALGGHHPLYCCSEMLLSWPALFSC